MGSCLSSVSAVVQQVAVQQANATTTTINTSPVTETSGTLPPTYRTLPTDTQKVSVRNVYDGDTLTLVDERRVRLLGIDTPEIKPPQPLAEEAKEYTKTRCHGQEVWLLINGKDHYGRLLAHVFVQDNGNSGGGYLCINEGLIQQGFAYAYIPNKDEKPFNWEKLLGLQREARDAKRGVWKTFKDISVMKTANGSAYHQRSCEHLSNTRNMQEIKISAAADLGLHPCRTCMAEA
jgi:micrococcal nuclease